MAWSATLDRQTTGWIAQPERVLVVSVAGAISGGDATALAADVEQRLASLGAATGRETRRRSHDGDAGHLGRR